ncbi:MAG TPA: polymer-forming cytoskeletal protein, partial [Methylomirabilota bacterium]|nr:polymer-forming cytoskeletal protein [Methylomirabilota bacterium]
MFEAIRRFFGFDPADEDELQLDAGARPMSPPVSSSAFRIGEKLAIKGEILGEGDLDLAGRFEGVINVNGRVVVGERAEVDADITAATIVVGGKVR